MSEVLVNDWTGTLSAQLPAAVGGGGTISVAAPGAPASSVGSQTRVRIGTEILIVTITTATSWTIVSREAEDSDRYPKQTWAVGTGVDGVLTAGGLTALAVNPNAALRNAANVFTVGGHTVTAEGNGVIPWTVQGNGTGGTQTADLHRWRDKDGRAGKVNARGAVIAAGGAETLGGQALDLSCLGYAGVGTLRITGSDGADNHVYQSANANLGLAINDDTARSIVFRTVGRRLATVGSVATLNDPTFKLWAQAGDANDRELVEVRGVFNGTFGSRKGQAQFMIWDTAARTCITLDTSGSAALIGFLGAAAVARQALAAAATDAATTQTLANSLRTALINLGLGA